MRNNRYDAPGFLPLHCCFRSLSFNAKNPFSSSSTSKSARASASSPSYHPTHTLRLLSCGSSCPVLAEDEHNHDHEPIDKERSADDDGPGERGRGRYRDEMRLGDQLEKVGVEVKGGFGVEEDATHLFKEGEVIEAAEIESPFTTRLDASAFGTQK